MSIVLGAFFNLNPNGLVGTSWRHPSNTSLEYLTIDYWTDIARELESGGFDIMFFADNYGYPTDREGNLIARAVTDATHFPMGDPITLVSAVAAATTTLGVVVTSSTTVERAPAVARRYGTLDHLTRGRIGWNIVTGAAQAAVGDLFGEEPLPHDARYEQAEEHLAVCLRLWEQSWEAGALREDKAASVFADGDAVHRVEFEGRYVRTRGAFPLPPSPQRTPFLVQAGTSEAGKNFAAKYAELVFVAGVDAPTIAGHVTDLRARAVENGRSADGIKMLAGAYFVLDSDDEGARAKYQDMMSYTNIEQAATYFAWATGIDLAGYPLDEPMPDLGTNEGQSILAGFQNLAEGRNATPREILERIRDQGINGMVFVGGPETVADEVEKFLDETEIDGFLLQPFISPQTYRDFIEHLVPMLRSRGIMSEEKEPTTLRRKVFPDGGDLLPAEHPGAQLRARVRQA